MSFLEAALHYFVDRDAEVLSGGNGLRKLRNQVQILMIVALEYLAMHEAVEVDQIADHARLIIDGPTHRDFDHVVVAVSVGIVALAIDRAVFFFGKLLAVQAVRGGKHVAPREVDDHAAP